LQLKLDDPIVERAQENPLDKISPAAFGDGGKIGLNDILNSIKKAKKDENIKGIFLDLTILQCGYATVEEIRNALIDFKDTGKFVIAYSEIYTQKTYYLATAADSIFTKPESFFEWTGLSAQVMFLKGALEKLEVEPIIIRHGKFKSAVEPLMYDKMSPENREQISKYVGSIWDHVLSGISEARNIQVDQLNNYANNLSITVTEDALKFKLIDGVKYRDELLKSLINMSGLEDKKEPNLISLGKYIKVPEKREQKGLAKDKVAIIYAYGDVQSGDDGEGTISSERISKAIREARQDSSIKAIVFRINSGGGSGIASDVIWREVKLAAEVKPVVASMGDVAASGGYYIAMAADTIVADPNTITGSIGVFGVFLNAKGLFNNKLGITFDVVNTNKHSDLGSMVRPAAKEEMEYFQGFIESFYDVFITKAAEGRGMAKASIDSIGQGRVWSGVNAMDLGLIDVFGGVNDAVKIAVEMAKLTQYRVVELPKLESPFEELIKDLTGDAKANFIKSELGINYEYFRYVEDYKNNGSIFARLPYEISIK
jgi:protease-4